ncbi:MAG: helix-turn-helix transcriptional regulator [Desulfofustis sp. PB-SRB1]|nr:helix-turn-helix transcriptional regulator [Desulfofustis sp. PB-SRB1]
MGIRGTEQGLTQIELGAKTDLSQVLISDYERGRLQPSPDTLIKMANAWEWRPMSFSASKVNQPAGASQA